ncbi:MAG: sugar transferase [Sphingomonas sp.]
MTLLGNISVPAPVRAPGLTPEEAALFASQKRSARVRAYISVALADVVAIGCAVLCAVLVWFDQPDISMLYRLLAVLTVVYFLTAISTSAYSHESLAERRRFVIVGVRSVLISIGLVFFILFAMKSGDNYSRAVVFLSSVSSVALIAVLRYFIWPRLGAPANGLALSELIILDGVDAPDGTGAAIVCADALKLFPDASSADSIERVCALAGLFDRVLVYCPADRRLEWAHTLRCIRARCELCIPELDALQPLSVSTHDGTTTAVVSERPLQLHQMALKRAFDLIVVVLLLPLLLPFMAAVAVAIKLDSKGPVFFRQSRLGIGNSSFTMLKFRSMYVDRQDKDAKRLTTRGDVRVTPVGRFIRRTSIDELPQLFNVLRGDMSIVGPRPHALMALAGTRLYWEVDQKYWYRHVAKPGITGLAQVRGFRGNTFEENDLRSRLASDLEYVAHWSLLRDVDILLATVKVLRHDKAF